jgi:hypothetical protein
MKYKPQDLAATMVRWFEGGVNQGLLPMTISDEESNLFCACHLLKIANNVSSTVCNVSNFVLTPWLHKYGFCHFYARKLGVNATDLARTVYSGIPDDVVFID